VKKLFKYCISLLFYSLLLIWSGCEDEDVREIYIDGEPIPDIEIFFPLGFYDAEPLMPKISPDEKKLLFTGPASLPEWKGLWIMDLETQVKTLVHPDGRSADWAPDSEWIAFNTGTQIFKIRSDGTELTQLTFDGSNFFPDWSPSNYIYYDSNEQSASGLNFIWRMDIDGANKIRLSYTPELGENRMPDCSFDGNQIAHIRYIGIDYPELFLMDNNGTSEIRLTYNNFDELVPRLNNTKIAFYNSSGIYLIDSDGLNITRILPNHLYNSDHAGDIKLYTAYPSWHPDGKHIVYEHFKIARSKRIFDDTYVEGTIQFYKVNADSASDISNLK